MNNEQRELTPAPSNWTDGPEEGMICLEDNKINWKSKSDEKVQRYLSVFKDGEVQYVPCTEEEEKNSILHLLSLSRFQCNSFIGTDEPEEDMICLENDNIDKINWESLSIDSNALELIEQNNINWESLSIDSNALKRMEQNSPLTWTKVCRSVNISFEENENHDTYNLAPSDFESEF
jgi:hypothetical protein